MKLISLNTWGCRVTRPLLSFIHEHAASTDIFCFQEILSEGTGVTDKGEPLDAYEQIRQLLPEHTGHFTEYGSGGYNSQPSESLDFRYGIASFVRASYRQRLTEGMALYDPSRIWGDYTGRFAAGAAQAITIDEYAVINVHGLWQGSIKTDTEAKIEQSKKLIELAARTPGKKVLCGDFNVLPETMALDMVREIYVDLVRQYNIQGTRSALYTKEIRHAAYVFVDEQITVKDFLVPTIEVSDHLPLSVEFN